MCVRVCVCAKGKGSEHTVLQTVRAKGTMNHRGDKWVKIKRDKSRSDCVPTVNCIFYSTSPKKCRLGEVRGAGATAMVVVVVGK